MYSNAHQCTHVRRLLYAVCTASRHCVVAGVGLDPAKPPPKKAKQLRLERKLAKRSQSAAVGDSETLPVSITKALVLQQYDHA